MGDPVAAARHARKNLRPGGTVLLIEPFAMDSRLEEHRRNPDGHPVLRGINLYLHAKFPVAGLGLGLCPRPAR